MGAVPEGALWDRCPPGWASPFGCLLPNLQIQPVPMHEGAHWSQLLSCKALPGMEGVAKKPQIAYKKRIAVKARESQGSWSLCRLVGGVSEAPALLPVLLPMEPASSSRTAREASLLCQLPLPSLSSLPSSLAPPPPIPPQPQSSLKISRQILLNREISPGCFPALPDLSLPVAVSGLLGFVFQLL